MAEGFGPGGALLWHSYVDVMDLDPGELANLRQACFELDECDHIQALIAQTAPLIKGSVGQVKMNPLYQEAREHRKVLLKLLAQIKVPATSAVTNRVSNILSLRAQTAARARWGRRKAGG